VNEYVDNVTAKSFGTGYTELASHCVRVVSNIRTKHFENKMSFRAVPYV
jgi:hypothetical protein